MCQCISTSDVEPIPKSAGHFWWRQALETGDWEPETWSVRQRQTWPLPWHVAPSPVQSQAQTQASRNQRLP